jgi:hypothetical protein
MNRVLGVIAGFVLWSVLWLCFNFALHKLGLFSPDLTQPMTDPKPLIALLIGSVLISLVTGYVAAAIVGVPFTMPVLALGILLVAVGIFFQSQVWHQMPLWYHLSFLLLLIPMCFVGARLYSPRAAM